MPRLDPIQFAGMLRELRGSRSQDEVAKMAGIPRHVLERLELGETKKPGFEDIVLICRAYEINVNDLAAALGLLPPPGQSWHPPVVANAMTTVRETLLEFDEEEQEELAEDLLKNLKFLVFGIKQDRAKKKQTKERTSKKRSFFPDWWQRGPRNE